MKKPIVFAAASVVLAASSVYALYQVSDRGTWPKSWPRELEPLRKQARTLQGPQPFFLHYEIPFPRRDQFESAWPHILKVKSKGAPVILVRGPYTFIADHIKAGAVVHSPSAQTDRRVN